MGNVNAGQPEKSIMTKTNSFNGFDIEQCDVQSKHLTPDEEHAEQNFKENV